MCDLFVAASIKQVLVKTFRVNTFIVFVDIHDIVPQGTVSGVLTLEAVNIVLKAFGITDTSSMHEIKHLSWITDAIMLDTIIRSM